MATRVRVTPQGDKWLHEIKFDGYRLLITLRAGSARLVTRGGHDWSIRYPTIVDQLALLGVRHAVLDGELIAVDAEGRSDFQMLQNARREQRTGRLQLQLFDVLKVGQWDLTGVPLIMRKELLQRIVNRLPASSPVRYSEHHRGDGSKLMAHACRMRLEGLISKVFDSPHTGGRTRSWVKSKCGDRQEFVIGGYSLPKGSRTGFGSLLLGYYTDKGELVYCGRVGTGFDNATLVDLRKRLQSIEISINPFTQQPTRAESIDARWVDPRLVAEVRFAQWTKTNRIRQPVFAGLRDDKDARDIRRERTDSQ